MKLGIRTALWKRDDTTRQFLAHYGRIADDLRSPSLEILPIAVHSAGPEYLEAVRSPASEPWRFTWNTNEPLSRKCQAGLAVLHAWGVDAVLNIGSDDFITATSIRSLIDLLSRGHDCIGWSDCYFTDRDRVRYWPGYPGARKGEPIGAGRTLSRKLLDKLNWSLWEGATGASLDGTAWKRITAATDKILTLPSSELGPLVDVKEPGNLTPWDAIVPITEPLDPEEGSRILKEVGL